MSILDDMEELLGEIDSYGYLNDIKFNELVDIFSIVAGTHNSREFMEAAKQWHELSSGLKKPINIGGIDNIGKAKETEEA